MSKRYREYGPWLLSKIGMKTQKISINAGFTCPNRDGSVGVGGCTYCNNQTFNPSYCETTKSITQQLVEGKTFFARKYPTMKYLAYFQAYTNTYASLDDLKRKYEEALSVEDVVGIVIGTRPDCMPEPLLDYLANLNHQCFLTVEYGIESTNDIILQHINRGHDFACTQQAVKATHERGILTGGHIILGLPLTHTIPNYLQQEAENISKLPLDTFKIHQLQLIKGTKMAEEYVNRPEHFHLYQSFEYIDEVIDFLELIRPELIVERFVSQSPSSLLAIPGWGLKNYEFVEKVNKRLEERDTYQGRLYHIV